MNEFVKYSKTPKHEYNILRRVNSLRIADPVGYEPQLLSTIKTQYIQGKTLENVILGSNMIIESQKINTLSQIMYAICEIHESNVIHRDIKPDNILIDNFGQVRIIDFGVATENTKRTTRNIGSIQYCAPEMFERSHDFKCDIYSFGLVVYFVMFERHPFANMDHIKRRKLNGELPPFPKNSCRYFEFLVRWLCARNPDDRPSDLIATYLVEDLAFFKSPLEYAQISLGVPLDLRHEWTILFNYKNIGELAIILDFDHPVMNVSRSILEMDFKWNVKWGL